jgi:hypothetical protein
MSRTAGGQIDNLLKKKIHFGDQTLIVCSRPLPYAACRRANNKPAAKNVLARYAFISPLTFVLPRRDQTPSDGSIELPW